MQAYKNKKNIETLFFIAKFRHKMDTTMTGLIFNLEAVAEDRQHQLTKLLPSHQTIKQALQVVDTIIQQLTISESQLDLL